LSGSRECLIRLLTSRDQLKLEREPMKCILTAAIAFGVVSSGAAFSQINPSTTSPIPPAVSTGDVDSKTSAAPVAGANSFTQSQAKKRIEAHGYSDVMELTKDDNSIWRGKAMKGGKQVGVATTRAISSGTRGLRPMSAPKIGKIGPPEETAPETHIFAETHTVRGAIA
jgi:hypothetical protein